MFVLAEPLWTDSDLKSGAGRRHLISTFKKRRKKKERKKSAGGKRLVELSKKKTPKPHIQKKNLRMRDKSHHTITTFISTQIDELVSIALRDVVGSGGSL